MEIPPPPKTPPVSSWKLTRLTPIEVIEDLIFTSVIPGDIQRFETRLDSLAESPREFDLCDLSPVMIDAVRRDRALFILELAHRGFPMNFARYALDAVKSKAKRTLEIFLQRGWDINEPMSQIHPPVLSEAINDEEMTRWLLDHGADPNRQSFVDITPLSCAVADAPIHIIKLLLDRGGDARRGELLQHAIDRKEDAVEVLLLLLERGAPLNLLMYQNHPWSWRLFLVTGLGTPLHKATRLKKVGTVRYLLDQGADTSIKDSNGSTALDYAKQSNQLQIMKLLKSEG